MKSSFYVVAGSLIALVAIASSSCLAPRATTQPPAPCVEAEDWPTVESYYTSVLTLCENQITYQSSALCDRLDYLESKCYGINRYRQTLRGVE